MTRQWWAECAGQYELYISQLVIDESGAGVTSAARERLELIEALQFLNATLETDQLATALIAAKAIPETEPRDAFHISIAATNGVKYLLTWNFKHIANPVQLPIMRGLCAAKGYRLPELVSPLEMLES